MLSAGIAIAGLGLITQGSVGVTPRLVGASGVPAFDHIFIVIMENTSAGSIVGNTTQAPYINSLARQYAYSANYSAITHPSLPNYLALTGGSAFGITSDCSPLSCPVNAPNIGDRLTASGKTWKAYMEDMPVTCGTTDSYPYAVKHDPFVYYRDIGGNAALCGSHVQPFARMASDLQTASSTPAYAWVTPNLCHDMHDCSIKTGDDWLSLQIPSILNSPAFTQQNSLLLITWDEDDSSGANQVDLIAVGSAVKRGYVSSAPANHYSLLRTVEAAWGLSPLTANDGGASSLDDLFVGSTPTPGPTPSPSPPPTGGYNILTSFGGIYSFGNATYYGNLIDHGYPGPTVGLAETQRGHGYEILNTSGAIYSFGDAGYFGSLLDHHYPGRGVAISMTPSGGGYAILTAAGAIYSFGDAGYFGNLLDHGYPGPAVSLAYTASGHGYWILTASGAIYSFGDALYHGNLLDHGYPGPATGMATSPQGYSILTQAGAIYSFGDAVYHGNLLDHGYPGPAVAMAATP